MSNRVLVVDDQVSFGRHISALLQGEGYEVALASKPEDALNEMSSRTFDILLADMKMPGMTGLELYNNAKIVDPDISCIIMTAYGSISSAVDSIKQGVTDYVQKPFEPETLLLALDKTIREREMVREIKALRQEVDERYSFGNIIGKNREMKKLYDLIEKVAPTNARVLITGETGVGKELVAKAIHFNSKRKNKPFVAINCGALPETLLESELFGYEKGAFTGALGTKPGKFEHADGGTIFLDEVGDISPLLQVKLLRVLQEKQFDRVGGNTPISVDVRIISATNQDLREKINKNEFRVDLFYRLNVVPIHIPALRDRREDIPALVSHFIRSLNRSLNSNIVGVSSRAMGQLMQYDWPGNVRELENILERHFVTTDGDTIGEIIFQYAVANSSGMKSLEHVNTDIPFPIARSMALKSFERAYLREALERYHGNVSETARKTGINARTLWRKMKGYGLERRKFSP